MFLGDVALYGLLMQSYYHRNKGWEGEYRRELRGMDKATEIVCENEGERERERLQDDKTPVVS